MGALVMLGSLLAARLLAAGPSEDERPKKALALYFYRPTAFTPPAVEERFAGVEDPAPGQAPRQFLISTAQKCEIRKFKMDAQFEGEDATGPATLYVDPDEITDYQFSCLTERVRYPYISFERVNQNCDTSGPQARFASDTKGFGPAEVCLEVAK